MQKKQPIKKLYLKKALGVLLSLALLCPALSSSAVVEKTEEAEKFLSLSSLSPSIQKALDLPAGVEKILIDDDLYSVTYETGPGTYSSKIYTMPIKYQDNEEIKFIDTGMSSRNVFSAVFSGYEYENEGNQFSARFSTKARKGVQFDGSINLGVDTAVKLPAGNVDNSDKNGAGRITYPEAYGEKTHLEFKNTYTGVMSNIVLEEKVDRHTFDFLFTSSEYRPVLSEDNTRIAIVDVDGNEAWTISPIYVFDSYVAGAEGDTSYRHYNEDGYYMVSDLGDGQYRITAVVSEEFLNDPRTVYPVTIDPTFTRLEDVNKAASNVDDTYVQQTGSNATGAANVNLDYLRIGKNSSAGRIVSYLRFKELIYISNDDAKLVNATLKLTYRSGQNTGDTVLCSRALSSWAGNTITYANQPGIAANGAKFTPKNGTTFTAASFDVTAIYNYWSDYSFENYGLRLEYASSLSDTNTFVSSNGEINRVPTLTVYYETYINSGSYYCIASNYSHDFLSSENGRISIYSPEGLTPDLKWKITYSNGCYQIKDETTGYYLTQIIGTYYLQSYTSGLSDFYIKTAPNGNYIITNKTYSNNALTVNNDTLVALPANGSDAQVWQIFTPRRAIP